MFYAQNCGEKCNFAIIKPINSAFESWCSSGVTVVQEFRQYFQPLQTDEKGAFRTIVWTPETPELLNSKEDEQMRYFNI